jgi:hypothetical protein
MAPEIEFRFLEPIGRRVILVLRETGLLFLQLWATIRRGCRAFLYLREFSCRKIHYLLPKFKLNPELVP